MNFNDIFGGIANAMKVASQAKAAFKNLSKEVKQEMANAAINAVKNKALDHYTADHQGKQFTGTLYDKNKQKYLTIFIVPERNEALLTAVLFIQKNPILKLVAGFYIQFDEIQPEIINQP